MHTCDRDAHEFKDRRIDHQMQPDLASMKKMPFHHMELETLIETYPDALFIQTHREPARFMGSWNSLVERVRSMSSEPRPPHDLGAEQLAFMSSNSHFDLTRHCRLRTRGLGAG